MRIIPKILAGDTAEKGLAFTKREASWLRSDSIDRVRSIKIRLASAEKNNAKQPTDHKINMITEMKEKIKFYEELHVSLLVD
jgi:hypothetical protein